jgi:hypothetical protein
MIVINARIGIFKIGMIPKKLHYVWLGGQDKPDLIKRCIASWRQALPAYEIIEWNESNITSDHPYFIQACRDKRYGFASDIVRLEVLNQYGGIYLDTDVEIRKNLDGFLENTFFLGMEFDCLLSTSLIGVMAGHPLLQELLRGYDDLAGQYIVNNNLITEYFLQRYPDFKLTGKLQKLSSGISIYPKEYFVMPPFALTSVGGYARHHATNTWRNKDKRSMAKRMVNFLLGDALYMYLAHQKAIRVNPFYAIYKQHKRLK